MAHKGISRKWVVSDVDDADDEGVVENADVDDDEEGDKQRSAWLNVWYKECGEVSSGDIAVDGAAAEEDDDHGEGWLWVLFAVVADVEAEDAFNLVAPVDSVDDSFVGIWLVEPDVGVETLVDDMEEDEDEDEEEEEDEEDDEEDDEDEFQVVGKCWLLL